MDLQQLPVPDQIADGDRLGSERLGLATTAGLVPVSLQVDQLGGAPGLVRHCGIPQDRAAPRLARRPAMNATPI